MTVLHQQMARLTARYEASPLPAFLSWWGGELLSALPGHWRQRIWPPRERLLVNHAEGRIHLWRASGAHCEEVLALDPEHDEEFARDQVQQLLASYQDAPPQAVLCLPHSQVLNRRLTMPAAAEAALGQALAFEMDRHTPFSSSDVYFDYHIASREKDENLISIDLYVCLRDTLDRLCHSVERIGLKLEGVDINTAAVGEVPQLAGANLLPMERRVRHGSRRTRFNWVVAGLAVVLLAAVMAESLYLQERTIQHLEEELEIAQQEARIVRNLRSELEDAMAAAGFLGERKRNSPAIMSVLGEVSQLLPHDTWVQRMQVTGTELQLQGLSDGAQRLIELLNSASVLEGTYFKGATTTDQRLNKERFTVAANIVMSQMQTRDTSNAATSGP